MTVFIEKNISRWCVIFVNANEEPIVFAFHQRLQRTVRDRIEREEDCELTKMYINEVDPLVLSRMLRSSGPRKSGVVEQKALQHCVKVLVKPGFGIFICGG